MAISSRASPRPSPRPSQRPNEFEADDLWLGDLSTRDLMRRALRSTRRLAQIEIALAKDEMQEQVKAALRAVLWGAISFAALIIAVAGVLVSLAFASNSEARFAGTFAIVSGLVALLCALFAYRARPRRLLPRTRERLEREATLLAKHAI